MAILSAEELLAGGDITHRVTVPSELLGRPNGSGGDPPTEVELRPLLLADIVRLHRAAGADDELASVLMLHQALVEPSLTVQQVHRLPAGLVEMLLAEVNRLSGLTLTSDDLQSMVHEPLAKACVVLAREFGWTPDTCSDLTVGQVLLYLEMIGRGERP